MTTSFSTAGGHVTRSETYTKLIHHLDEARDCAAVLSHLYNTEDDAKAKLLARAWLQVSEQFKGIRWRLTELMKGTLS
jgi:hypothetical protein